MILGRDDLLAALRTRLAEAHTLEVAVAWATHSSALNAVVEFSRTAKTRPRIIVGISGNATAPSALRMLARTCELKVSKGEYGTFHPKFYRFVSKKGAVCWTGSANLTKRGFGINDEAVHEFKDDGTGRDWFRRLWNSIPANASTEIDAYEESWEPPSSGRDRTSSVFPPTAHPIGLIAGDQIRNWGQYEAALKACDSYWLDQDDEWHFSVLGEAKSYINTIACGAAIAQSPDWGALTREEVHMLLGSAGEAGSGLLGSMKGAGAAVGAFLNSTALRRKIQKIVLPLQSENDFPRAAAEVVTRISDLDRFSSGVATRLITLIRPDCGVSVNKGSRRGLSRLSGLPYSTLGKPKNYRKLLEWVASQRWHNTREPVGSFGQMLWSMRAALLDSFVYLYGEDAR